MANTTRLSSTNVSAVTPQALESLQKLRSGLYQSASDALNAQDTYMHGVYTELLALVSAKVLKAQARMSREQVASHRKQHKQLRSTGDAMSSSERESA